MFCMCVCLYVRMLFIIFDFWFLIFYFRRDDGFYPQKTYFFPKLDIPFTKPCNNRMFMLFCSFHHGYSSSATRTRAAFIQLSSVTPSYFTFESICMILIFLEKPLLEPTGDSCFWFHQPTRPWACTSIFNASQKTFSIFWCPYTWFNKATHNNKLYII